ncbi:MAG: DUF4129 domain-containing protein, partial [Smithellaceae bacterium]
LTETTWLCAAMLVISAMSASGAQYAGFFPILALLTCAAWITRLCLLIPHPVLGRVLLLPVMMTILPAWFFWTFCTGSLTGGEACADVLSQLWHTGLGHHDASVFFTWVMGLYLSARGVWIGFSSPDVKTQARWMLVGTAVFVFLFAAWPHIRQAHPLIGQFRILASAYFLVGLVLLAFINTRKLGRFTGDGGEFSISWLIAIIIPTLLVIGLGLIFTGGFSSGLRWLFHLGLQAMDAAGAFLLWLGAWVMYFFAWLSNLLPKSGPRTFPPSAEKPAFIRRPLFQDFKFEDVSGSVATLSISVIVLILAALVVILFLLFRRQTRKELFTSVGEERTSVWSWGLVWNQIKKILFSIVKRLGYIVESALPATKRFSPSQEEADLTEIRRIYRRFLEWSAGRKQPRRPAQTPLELVREISTSAINGHLATITQCYQDVRYGEITATPPDVEKARQALHLLEKEDVHIQE